MSFATALTWTWDGKPALVQSRATDESGHPVTVVSDAPETYPLGETIVTWTATDSDGNSATVARDRTGRWALVALVAFLLLIQAGNVAGPPPPDTTAIAWVGQAQWLLVAWGYWVDRHRTPAATHRAGIRPV